MFRRPSCRASVLVRFLGIDVTHSALILFTISTNLPLVGFLMTGFARAMCVNMRTCLCRRRRDSPDILPGDTSSHEIHPSDGFVILVIIIWNEAFSPFFHVHGQEPAILPLRLTEGSRLQIAWNLLVAHLVWSPLIVLFFAAQRHIVGGLSEGVIPG